MHRCIDQPNMPRPGCEAQCDEETEILAAISASAKEEHFAKHCRGCGDPLDRNGSCLRCQQEELEEIRSGNWFGITCAIMLLCLPAFGQAAYSGPGLYSGSATYVASSGSTCTAPNFCAYNGVDLIPTPTAPSFSASGTNGLQNNGAMFYDTSYLGHANWDGSTFSNSAYLSPVTRVTDAYSAPGRTYPNFTAGMGGSGVFTLTNTDTSLVGLNDTSMERVCLFNTTGSNKGHCTAIGTGIFITTDLCVTSGSYTCPTGSSGQTQDFGSMSFSLTDRTKLFTFGNDTYDITSPTTVCPYTVNTALNTPMSGQPAGAYSLGTCVVDFKYGLPAYPGNSSLWSSGHSYNYGDYIIHVLTGAEMWNGTGTWTSGVAVNAGDIISSGSPACMYKATTGGTTGGTTPGFVTNGACKVETVRESDTGGGAVVWKGTASAPQFLYQNTATAACGAPCKNLDDTLTGWSLCYIGSCSGGGTPGGTGTPTSVSQTINNASPSLDGDSMALSFVAPSTSGTTNLLATYKAGANDTATSLSFDGHFYIPTNASLVSQFEFDQFILSTTDDIEYMFGSQCNKTAGFWQVWNQLSGTWVNTSVVCSLTAGTWYEIAETAHRVPGDTSCSGMPCLHYDSLTINGVAQSGFAMTEPAGPLPGGWTSNTGFQFQMNAVSAGSSGAAIVEYVDELMFSAGSTSKGTAFQWIATPSTLGSDGAMSKTTNPQQLTMSTSHPFTPAMVGQTISVSGADLSGATLYTTISSYTSSSVVTLAIPALTTVSGATVALTGHPDFFSSTVGDSNGIVWTNLGPAYIPTSGAQLWRALGGVSRDNLYNGNPSKYGVAVSTNTYGVSPKYSYAGGQGTGIWALEYDSITNVYHLLNTATGIWTDYACGSGNGFTCSGITSTVVGALTAITDPPAIGQACPSFLHNEKISSNGLFAELVFDPELYSACNSLQNFLVWTTTPSLFDTNNSLQYAHDGMTHWAIGANKVAAFHGSSFGGYSSGVFISIYDAASVGTAPVFSSWLKPLGNACANPPSGSGCIPQNTPPTPPGCYVTVGSTIQNPDCSISDGFDSHMSWVGDPGTDTYPICGTTYNAATLGPAWNAWQNMETCYPTTPTGCDPAVNAGCAAWPPNSIGPVWQFTHTFATGTSDSFSTQFQISQYSQDANWLFWSTDDDCQLGSQTGSAPAVYSGSGSYSQTLAVTAVPANPSSLCGLPWAASTAYVAGNMINPIEGTGGSSAVDDVFQALTSGTTGPQSSLNSNQPSCLVYVGGTLKQGSCFANTNPPTVTPLTITGVSEAGTTGTITVSNPGLTLNIGVLVTVAGFTGSYTGWNGTFAVTGTVGANCPGSACGSVTTFQLSGMPSGLSTPSSYSGTTATAQGDTVCDLTSPGQDSINASSCAGVTWQDLGMQTQRGDVFAVNLGNQH